MHAFERYSQAVKVDREVMLPEDEASKTVAFPPIPTKCYLGRVGGGEELG